MERELNALKQQTGFMFLYHPRGKPIYIWAMGICAAHQGGLFAASPDSGTGYENYKRGIFYFSLTLEQGRFSP